MFTVFGATGNTGSIVANFLLDQGKRVRAVTRDSKKAEALRARGAEIIEGDVTDRDTVVKALAGAEAAYLLTPPDNASTDLIARGKKIIDNYVAGLTQHKVPFAVVLSSVGSQVPSGTGPIVITHYAETTLAKVGTTKFTFLRAAYFMENILGNAWPMKQDGVLPVFGGGEGYPFPMVATKDIGDTAGALITERPAQNQVVELQGPQPYSFNDAAAEATKILGKPVKATPMPIEQMVPTLTQFGFSQNVAGLFREMVEAFGKGIGFENTGRSVKGKVPLADVLRRGLA